MICKNCGMTIEDDSKFCAGCGVVIDEPQQQKETPVYFTQVPEPVVKEFKEEDIPAQYSRLSAWSYFGLKMLFSIPVVGLVFLIVFSFSRGNLNRRSFARSYWCECLILGGVFLVALVLLLTMGFTVRDVVNEARFF